MNELSQSRSESNDWLPVNPSLLVSLALNLNRTGSCRLDELVTGASDDDPPVLVQQDGADFASGTKTFPRRGDSATATDVRPTPAPTGDPSAGTTVHIVDEHDFALLLPSRAQGVHDA